jgi:hypothetical protein
MRKIFVLELLSSDGMKLITEGLFNGAYTALLENEVPD